nr:acetate--CoA ligase family protein [Candidatus Gracilibacteria bacterium]
HPELEQKVQSICEQFGIALIGPNCLGVISPKINMNASFAAAMPKFGPVAFFSQSGALCTAVIDYANRLGIGFSKFVSMGNKALTDEVAMLDFLADDEDTKVVAMYVEDLRNAEALIAATQRLRAQNKPVIILKSGKTSAGASASASHTGSLAGNDAAYEALFRQAGILRANTVSELFDLAQVFANNDLPQGNRLAIITNAGGPGVLTTDTAILNDLELAELSESSVAKLQESLPPAANCHNPIDVLGDAKADRYQVALEIALADSKVDSVMVILTPQSMTEVEQTAAAVIAARQTSKKPLAVCFMGDESVKIGVEKLLAAGIAATTFPESAVSALATLTKFANTKVRGESDKFSFSDIDYTGAKAIIGEENRSFPEAEALPILAKYGFPLLKSRVVSSAAEAQKYAHEIGPKLVYKIVSPDILHKSDVGGVMLNIEPEQAGSAYEQMMATVSAKMPQAKLEGVLMVEMAEKGGMEIILGSTRDPNLGQMIMVGLGGIYVEILKDVSFGLAPLTKTDAYQMINSLKTKQLLFGARGQAELDVEALVDAIGRLSQLLVDFPQIKEMDINPLLVLPKGKGARLLDARIIVEN